MPEAPAGRRRLTRFRLLVLALLPMLVPLPALLVITTVRWNAKYDAALISKVQGDLTIAHQYLARMLENTGDRLGALAESAAFRDEMAAPEELGGWLEAKRVALGLDFLRLVDGAGATIAAAPPAPGPLDAVDQPLVAAALDGRALAVVDIFQPADLAAISPELAERARIEILPTPNAAPDGRRVESRGLMIHTAHPARLAEGAPGALVGGLLLNQNLAFIDSLNDLVYRAGSLPERSKGTVTLFLDDVRVGTNVRLFEGQRALGTRVSEDVRAAVLGRGETWLDRAFVVNDWYISGYEPILDNAGERVGMLYVGFLEAPFTAAKRATYVMIAAAFALAALVTLPLFLRWARGIFRPLERVTETISRVEEGDLSARTGEAAGGDEIGRVAEHLDHLLDQIEQRDRALRDWNDSLNARVEERTEALAASNRALEARTAQLVMAEKLATIGEITAGVAHEINNPIAVMRGNLDIIRETIDAGAPEVEAEFRLLDQQIDRIAEIVTRLLRFASPEEYSDEEPYAPGALFAECLPLIRHLPARGGVEIARSDTGTGRVAMNRTELRQVLVNLIVNAVHAMPEGGRLALACTDRDRDGVPGVALSVADTGRGMSAETLARVFDPFFTTRRGRGTGLGLSLSQTLVTRAGGVISAESAPGAGSTFTLWLPAAG